MDTRWYEKVTGSLEQKKRYRQYKSRIAALPHGYRTAAEALDRYFTYFGGISDGETLVTMLDDLASLFEQSAADEIPIRAIVGADPVEFAEQFLQNYAHGQWIAKERRRLVETIDRVAGSDPGDPKEGTPS